jgi:hypothetical protein
MIMAMLVSLTKPSVPNVMLIICMQFFSGGVHHVAL